MSMSDFIKNIPIVGGLFYASGASHWEAIKESFLAVLFSGLPILVPVCGAVVLPWLSVQEYLQKLTGEGELFLYASAFVGPLIYAVLKTRMVNTPEMDKFHLKATYIFPYAYSFIVISFFICIASIVSYVLIRLSPFGGNPSPEQHHAVLNVSIWVYVASIICLYSASVYRNELEDNDRVPNLMREEEREFLDEWNQR